MALKTLSTADLQAELARREKNAGKLQARREKLLTELADLDAEIVSLGGTGSGKATGKRLAQASSKKTGGGGGRRRAKNEMTLPDAIAAAMDVGAEVSPKEAAELVLNNGFNTHSKNFGMMVSNALAKDPRFKRLGRGLYARVK